MNAFAPMCGYLSDLQNRHGDGGAIKSPVWGRAIMRVSAIARQYIRDRRRVRLLYHVF